MNNIIFLISSVALCVLSGSAMAVGPNDCMTNKTVYSCDTNSGGRFADFSGGSCGYKTVTVGTTCPTKVETVTYNEGKTDSSCLTGARYLINVRDGSSCHATQETADAICRKTGYESGAILRTKKYSSPSSNGIAYWDGTEFVVDSATKRNHWITSMQCTRTVYYKP